MSMRFSELCIDAASSTGELGCWLDAGAEGHGIARAACDGVLDHAFSAGRLQRVEARIATTKLATPGGGDNTAFYKCKLMCAKFWMERLIPECPMLLERIQAGSETVMEFD